MTKIETLVFKFLRISGVILLLFYFYILNYPYFTSSYYNLTSYPNPSTLSKEENARFLFIGDPQLDGDARIHREGIRGQLSIYIDDITFKFIISRMVSIFQPTKIVVMGDLFSYQYVSNKEFNQRLQRYSRIFVENPLRIEVLNITGNHDIGYSAEMDPNILNRFEKSFGKTNYDFELANHKFTIVNSLYLDKPKEQSESNKSWEQLKKIELNNDINKPNILITHVPLWKKENTCGDKVPIINYEKYIQEQTHLTKETSNFILNNLKPKFIFTGHDHNGCMFLHNNFTKEYTLRSIMSDYEGHTGIFDIRWNSNLKKFDYNFDYISFFHTNIVAIIIFAPLVWFFLTLIFILYNILKCISLKLLNNVVTQNVKKKT